MSKPDQESYNKDFTRVMNMLRFLRDMGIREAYKASILDFGLRAAMFSNRLSDTKWKKNKI